MFLNYLKNFFLKNTLKNNWQNVNNSSTAKTIQTVGMLIDETNFFETEALMQELINIGFSSSKIGVIVYKDRINRKESFSRYTINLDALNWNGTFKEEKVNDFIQVQWDLLISYYAEEKPILQLITNNSKAHFKVGFSSIDSKFNHLMINTKPNDYEVFVKELFKYLKILNKIES